MPLSKAIDRELQNIRVSFRKLEPDKKSPANSKLINYHIMFDIKIDLTNKLRLVEGDNPKDVIPAYKSYSSVVECHSSYIRFLLVDFNGSNILAADIGKRQRERQI